VRLEVERRFPVGVREGFDYIVDQANWLEYWPGLVRIEPGARWGEPGDVTRIVVRSLRRELPMEMTLRRFDEPRGLYDRILVRRAVGRALNTTVANLDRAFGAGKLNR
jgi:hypothetical protein